MFRVSLFPLLSVGGFAWRGNDEHDLSGFYVPENFREPEFLRPDNYGFLFFAIRLIGVHLFWVFVFGRVRFRRLSPPSGWPGDRREVPAPRRGRRTVSGYGG